MAILETRSVTYSYNDGSQERTILRDVNVDFDAGKFYTITGASGSGKTTLLALLSALDIPTSGTILFDGRSLAEIGEEAYRRQHIGIVFQNFNLISYMSAVDNVRIALGIIGEQDKQETTQKALTLLADVGIDATKAKRVVKKLSGGEQQRVAIARALAKDAAIIFADEPTGNLDVYTSKEIVDLFKKLAYEKGKCVILVTHDPGIAAASDIEYVIAHQNIERKVLCQLSINND